MKGPMPIEPALAKGGISSHGARLHCVSLTGPGGAGKTLPARSRLRDLPQERPAGQGMRCWAEEERPRTATHVDRLFIEVPVRTAGDLCPLESNVRPAHRRPSALFLLHDSP